MSKGLTWVEGIGLQKDAILVHAYCQMHLCSQPRNSGLFEAHSQLNRLILQEDVDLPPLEEEVDEGSRMEEVD